MEITIEEIQKKFDSLPEDLKWAIMASDVDEKITDIGKLNNLTVEQMRQLSLETHMVMFGFTHPDKFEKSLEASLKLTEDKTKRIANVINERILKNIREQVMNLHKNPDHINMPIQKEDTREEEHKEVFKSAGIEILPNQKEKENKMLPKEDKLNKNKIESSLTNKLSGKVHTPIRTTEYTLNNITKEDSTPDTSGYTDKIDPYREIPE
jgi:hypothetical protein